MNDTDKKKLEAIALRLDSLARHYLQHIRLDDMKPRDVASQFMFEAGEIRAVAEGKPTH